MRALVGTSIALPLIAGLALANHGPGTSGGGTSTISGETLRAGGFDLSLRADATWFEHLTRAEAEAHAIQSGEFDALRQSLVWTAGLSYGITDDLQVDAFAGQYQGTDFIDAEADGMGGVESATADPEGMTDLWVLGKLRLIHGTAGHLAALAGIKFPTGKDDVELSNGEELEPSSQPGTGAYDYLAGFAYSRYLTNRSTMDVSSTYTLRTEHDDFEVGDRVDVGVAYAYRLTESLQSFPNSSLSAELLGTWLEKDSEDGDPNPNSGGSVVYFAPGFRVRTSEGTGISMAPAIPIYQDTNGDQPDVEWKLALTFTMTL